MKQFPLDIQSVAEHGAATWLKEDYDFPINNIDFVDMWNELIRSYYDSFSNAPKDLQAVYESMLFIVRQMACTLSSIKVFEKLEESGLEPKFHENNIYFSAVKKENYAEVIRIGVLNIPRFRSRLKNKLKKVLSFCNKNQEAVAYSYPGRPYEELVEYADRHKLTIIEWSPDYPLFFKDAKKELADIEKVTGKVCNSFKTIAESRHFSFPSKLKECLREELNKSCYSGLKLYRSLKKSVRSHAPQTFFIKSLGKPLPRLLSNALRSENHQVVSSGHGNNVGILKYIEVGGLELGMCSKYLSPNKNSTKLLELSRQASTLSKNKQVEILSINTLKYEKLWKESQKLPLSKEIKKVMVVEGLMGACTSIIPSGFWFFNYKLQAELGENIKAVGKHAVIKPRPETNCAKSIYQKYFDEVQNGTFEKVYQNADILIFPALASTTFGFALTTVKPIVIFEHCLENIWEDVHDLLRKRCFVIPSKFDGISKVEFDAESLKSVLRRPINQPNIEILEKYML